MELFVQTIQITVVGMGLTFAAIGVLVVTMFLLTRWTREREELARDDANGVDPPTASRADDIQEEAKQAAAAAIAVALALEAQRAAAVYARHASRAGEDISLWRADIRSQ